MKTIQALLLGVFALAAVGCTETVYVHPHRSYSTVPGTPVHISNPGAPETFTAESR